MVTHHHMCPGVVWDARLSLWVSQAAQAWGATRRRGPASLLLEQPWRGLAKMGLLLPPHWRWPEPPPRPRKEDLTTTQQLVLQLENPSQGELRRGWTYPKPTMPGVLSTESGNTSSSPPPGTGAPRLPETREGRRVRPVPAPGFQKTKTKNNKRHPNGWIDKCFNQNRLPWREAS